VAENIPSSVEAEFRLAYGGTKVRLFKGVAFSSFEESLRGACSLQADKSDKAEAEADGGMNDG
jgi:hypothetical protein